jgi:serine/threonine protein kinase
MRFVIKEIANGIKEIHDMGLANRDLTPENILIQEIPILQGNVQEKYKIFDFGTI